MILRIGNISIYRTRAQTGFTFLEILAVVALMAVLFTLAITQFSGSAARLRSSAYQLSKDIQGTSFAAIKKAKVMRIAFQEDKQTYFIQVFEPPKPKPKADDRKAMEEWENAQKELENLNAIDRSALTLLERGSFKTLKKQSFSYGIQLKEFYSTRAQPKVEAGKSAADSQEKYIFFMPTGDTDHALLVLEGSTGNTDSLEVHPLTAKVTTSHGEISEEEWKKKINSK
ncbi:MAG: prepilin-type N-terminal cleavage/methylation domain-containing protein [Deltaproteobacteria bacterium]|nr:prepilin-type N-terminal cleavage/methylation domain-containing protein [Deltaproteobacteria bacterium]